MNAPLPTVLIVEDTPDTLELLEVTLRFKGYRVLTATNGQDALEIIQRERPAIVITDILMPKMDGFSLVHRLRINPATRMLPVIFLSATYVAPEDKEFAAAIGATRFIEKPISIPNLLSAVQFLLDRNTVPLPKWMTEEEFYEGYRKRLKEKLEEKITQIARTEGMVESLSGKEKKDFRKSLDQMISERDEIQFLLNKLYEQANRGGKQ